MQINTNIHVSLIFIEVQLFIHNLRNTIKGQGNVFLNQECFLFRDVDGRFGITLMHFYISIY